MARVLMYGLEGESAGREIGETSAGNFNTTGRGIMESYEGIGHISSNYISGNYLFTQFGYTITKWRHNKMAQYAVNVAHHTVNVAQNKSM